MEISSKKSRNNKKEVQEFGKKKTEIKLQTFGASPFNLDKKEKIQKAEFIANGWVLDDSTLPT